MQTDLARFFQIKFDNAVSETGALAGKLDALSPLKVLDRPVVGTSRGIDPSEAEFRSRGGWRLGDQ